MASPRVKPDMHIPSAPSDPDIKKPKAGNTFLRMTGLQSLVELGETFGVKFLLIIFIGLHLNKGLNMAQVSSGFVMLLKDLKVPAATQDILKPAARMPFSMKPLIALVSDSFPIFGYRKMPYMLATAAGAIVGVAIIVWPGISANFATIGCFLVICSSATVDILIEGHYSRKLTEFPEKGPALVSFVWMGMFAMGIVTNFSVVLIEKHMGGVLGLLGAQWAMSLAAIPNALLIYPLFSNWLGETPITPEEARENRRKLSKQPELVGIALMVGALALLVAVTNVVSDKIDIIQISWGVVFTAFVVSSAVSWTLLRPLIGNLIIFNAINNIAKMTPDSAVILFLLDGPEAYPEGPHFTYEFYFMGVASIGSAIAVVVSALYGACCKSWRYRTIYIALSIVYCIISFPACILYSRKNLEWGIPDKVFIIGDTVLGEVVTGLLWMPGFLILSRVCPANVESTVFAIVASSSNFSQDVASVLGGMLGKVWGCNPTGGPGDSEEFKSLWEINILCSCLKLLPVLFVFLIPNARQDENFLAPDDRVSATIGSPFQRCLGIPDRVTEEHLAEQAKENNEKIFGEEAKN